MPVGGFAGALQATHRRAPAALEGPPPLASVMHDDLAWGGHAATNDHMPTVQCPLPRLCFSKSILEKPTDLLFFTKQSRTAINMGNPFTLKTSRSGGFLA